METVGTMIARVLCCLLLTFGSVTAATVACSEHQEWIPARTSIRVPLPEVARSDVRNTVFDEPAVVLLVQFRQRWEIEELDEHRKSLDPPRFFHAARADAFVAVRVNERRKEEPDLARATLVVDQRDRRDHALKFEFGRYYLLLLNPTKIPFYVDYETSQVGYDSYTLAVPQGGFEVVNGKLRPLVSGGALDPYAGRDANEVIKELQVK